jgi:hypothetical protein
MRATVGISPELAAIYADSLPVLQRVLDSLDEGYVLVGGIAVQYWLTVRPVRGFPVRPTADIDVGIDRMVIGSTGDRTVLRPLLDTEGFRNEQGDEEFRFRRKTAAGSLVLDIVVAPGASRETPPLAEMGMPSVAAPGLAYAFIRGPVRGEIEFNSAGGGSNLLVGWFPALDAAFVLKAALVESGVRTRPDRVQTDTSDAVLLAAAMLADEGALATFREHASRSEVKRATKWFKGAFATSESIGSNRLRKTYRSEEAVELAMDIAERL